MIGRTLTTAEPATLPLHPELSVTDARVYVVVEAGVTLRVAGELPALLGPGKSDHCKVHEGVPVRSTESVADEPALIVALPLTVAVGVAMETGRVPAASAPQALVTTTDSVTVPTVPAVKDNVEVVSPETIAPPCTVHR
jgi:hypothetical protein